VGRPPRLACGLFLALVLVGCGGSGTQSPSAVTPTPSPTPSPGPAGGTPFASRVVGDSFQLYVALPQQYETDSGSRYPVVYLLDANWNFEPVRDLVRSLASEGRMEPVILVSVCPVQALQGGYGGTAPARCRDLTPTAVASYPGSGHAEDFAAFLRTELIPYVDATYRTRPTADDRCLMGHSLAGLFTWYAVLRLDDVIHKFVPASASLFWDDHVMLEYEVDYARDHTDLPARVYSTVSTGEGPDMVNDRDEWVDRLRSRGYPRLRIQTATYVGIEHNQSSGPAFREGLTELF
jgi:predicted alpha/beta superfamily hydrolase